MKIKLIAALAANNAIGGEDGKIPWSFHPEDMKLFSSKTKSEGGTVVMGRKTFLSLPEKFRPLPDRKNIVLTRNLDWKYEGVEVFNNKESLLESLRSKGIETLWVCGGGEIYAQFIDSADELHLSHFNITPESAVAFFPNIDHTLWKEIESRSYVGHAGSPEFTHTVYKKVTSI